jgi:signal transduction histidine kinase
MVRLIDDLLDVARVNRGKIRLNKQPLDLATVLDRAVETTRPAICDQRHDLAADYPHGELFLEGDPVRLEQVILRSAGRLRRPCMLSG